MGEAVQGRQVVGVDESHPSVKVFAAAAGEQAGELPDALCKDVQVRTCCEGISQVLMVVRWQVSGPGHQRGNQTAW